MREKKEVEKTEEAKEKQKEERTVQCKFRLYPIGGNYSFVVGGTTQETGS